MELRNSDLIFLLAVTNMEINSLPPEIIALIFGFMESMKDLQSCMEVCDSWKKILRNKYRKKRYIRVVYGEDTNFRGTEEIIDLLGHKEANNIVVEGISQCENFMIFLSLRFYVKSILGRI